MNKAAKALLIPVAAFAVTATSAYAFNTEVLQKAGLSDDQISAVQEAHELRKDGDREGAREVIIEAGIDHETMRSVREAVREHRAERRSEIHAAVEAEDYDAFKDAAADSPLLDIITSEDDFERFVEAHELRGAGDREAAREIMEDLGFEPREGKHKGHRGFKGDRD